MTGHAVDRNADWCVHSAAARKRREQAAALAASKLTGREEGEDDEEGARDVAARQRVGRGLRRRMHLGRIMDVTSEGANLRMATHPTTLLTTLTMHLTLTMSSNLATGRFNLMALPAASRTTIKDEGRLLGDAALANRPASVRAALADLDPDCLNVDLVAETVLCGHLSGQHRESGLEARTAPCSCSCQAWRRLTPYEWRCYNRR